MLKKLLFRGLIFICCIMSAFILGVLLNPFKILNNSVRTFNTVTKNPKLEKIYDVNFIMSEQPVGNTNIFLPKMLFTDIEQAVYFSEFFGINRNFTETDSHYVFFNEKGRLEINKFGGRLKYMSEKEAEPTDDMPEDSFIIEKGFEFAKDHLDYFDYEEVEISFQDNIFELYFIERLGNLKNYAFPTYITLDKKGNVLTMEYYYNVYERLSNYPIKSMKSAFWELPDDFEQDIVVDLKKGTLVYYYLDSIVQPCYLFEGEIPGGKSFRSFVRASLFGQ